MKKSKSLIHVNQHVLRANLKGRVDEPMLTCKQGSKKNTYAHEVDIYGPCKFVNSMARPLSCGARVWVHTEAEVALRYFEAPASFRKPASGVSIIRVNPQAIRNNLKNGTNEPVLICARGGDLVQAHEVIIHGPAKVRTANMALEHETSIWVETEAEIEIVEPSGKSVGQSCSVLCEQE